VSRADDLDRYEAKLHAAIEAVVSVLEDPELTYASQRIGLIEALRWLELDVVCGDCKEGRCHGAPEEECGCRHHESSVEAAVRALAIAEWAVDGWEPLIVEGRA
jgi:hypothetical protein